MNFQPLNNRVLIKPDEAPTMQGDIALPESTKKRPTSGTVVAVDLPSLTVSGCVSVGDHVFYGAYTGDDLEIEGTKYLLIKEEDLLGVTQDSK